MTTTRAGTWSDASKGLRVQAKDGSIWTLEAMKLEEGVISVTMAAEAEPGRTVTVHPASYADPITIVETVPWASDAADARPQGLQVAAEALAAQIAASPTAPTGFPPLSDAERAAKTPAERAIAAKETLARHTAELQAKLAEAPAIAAAALAGVPYVAPMPELSGDQERAAQAAPMPEPPSVVAGVPYVAPMPEVQPDLAANLKASLQEATAPETSAETAPVVDPASVAPIQAVGEVWPSPPADDWTEGEMYAHLFLFHGDWATGQTTAKSGKKLLLELHERHQKAHETGHTAGIVHLHRSKE